MFLVPFFKKKSPDPSLLIHIGSSTISVGLVLFNEQKPTIIYDMSTSFSVTETVDSNKIHLAVTKALDGLLQLVIMRGIVKHSLTQKNIHFSSVLVSFESPWFVSKIKSISLRQDKAFVITPHFIQNIFDVEEKIFERELANNEYRYIRASDARLAEQTLLRSTINGYEMEMIMGTKTKSFDATLYISVVSKSITDIVFQYISKHTHMDEKAIHMYTVPTITGRVARILFPEIKNFLLLNISGEVTDVTLFSNGVIVQTTSFPSGKNFIIRHISKSFHVSTEIAKSMIHMYITLATDETVTAKMKKILTDIEMEWNIYIEDAWSTLSKDTGMPSRVYITSDDDVAPLYTDFLKFSHTSSTPSYPKKNIDIIHINNTLLSSSYNTTTHLPSNIFLISLALYYKTLQ